MDSGITNNYSHDSAYSWIQYQRSTVDMPFEPSLIHSSRPGVVVGNKSFIRLVWTNCLPQSKGVASGYSNESVLNGRHNMEVARTTT